MGNSIKYNVDQPSELYKTKACSLVNRLFFSLYSINNQDNWITFVCFLTPDFSVNQIYVDLIEKAMQVGIRRQFDFISKRDFLEAVRNKIKIFLFCFCLQYQVFNRVLHTYRNVIQCRMSKERVLEKTIYQHTGY